MLPSSGWYCSLSARLESWRGNRLSWLKVCFCCSVSGKFWDSISTERRLFPDSLQFIGHLIIRHYIDWGIDSVVKWIINRNSKAILWTEEARGSVKVLCYKPEGRGLETRWGELIFSIYLILADALGPGVHSATNRNEYQKQKNNVSGE
jgi:hypothetical protein